MLDKDSLKKYFWPVVITVELIQYILTVYQVSAENKSAMGSVFTWGRYNRIYKI